MGTKTKVAIGLSMFGIIIVITALSSVYFIIGILSFFLLY